MARSSSGHTETFEVPLECEISVPPTHDVDEVGSVYFYVRNGDNSFPTVVQEQGVLHIKHTRTRTRAHVHAHAHIQL